MAGIPNNQATIRERREKLWTLLTRGMKRYEIAKELNVNPSTISRDIQWSCNLEEFRDMGYDNLISLKTGFTEWKNKQKGGGVKIMANSKVTPPHRRRPTKKPSNKVKRFCAKTYCNKLLNSRVDITYICNYRNGI